MRRTMNDYMGATVEIISGNEKYEIGMVVGFEDHMLVIDLANGGTVRKNVDEIKVKWEE